MAKHGDVENLLKTKDFIEIWFPTNMVIGQNGSSSSHANRFGFADLSAQDGEQSCKLLECLENHRMVWLGSDLKGHLIPLLCPVPWVGRETLY